MAGSSPHKLLLDPRFLRWLLAHQFSINCLASVAMEYPALRNDPRLRDGL